MESKSGKASEQKDVLKNEHTTVSLARVIRDMSRDLMLVDGYNGNFSAFVAQLIRDEYRRRGQELDASPEMIAAIQRIAQDHLRRDPKNHVR